MVAIFYWIRRFSFEFYKKECNGGFEVADYDFDVKNRKFKMADSMWSPLLTKFKVFFRQIVQKYVWEGFRGRLSRLCNEN